MARYQMRCAAHVLLLAILLASGLLRASATLAQGQGAPRAAGRLQTSALAPLRQAAMRAPSGDLLDRVAQHRSRQTHVSALTPSYASTQISCGSPLATVTVGQDTSLQIEHTGRSPPGQIYPSDTAPGDAGAFLRVGTMVYGPDFSNHGGTGTPGNSAYTPFTPLGQTSTSTSVTTLVGTPDPSVTLTQIVRCVPGQSALNITYRLGGTATSTVVTLFQAADLALGATGATYGVYDPSTGAIGGQNTDPTTNSPPTLYTAFVPLTPASHYQEDASASIWDAIATAPTNPGPGLTDIFFPHISQDSGIALQWDGLRPQSAPLISTLWTFAPHVPVSVPHSVPTPTPIATALPISTPVAVPHPLPIQRHPFSAPFIVRDLGGYARDRIAIAALIREGILRPVLPGCFVPAAPATRVDAAVALQRLFRLPPPSHVIYFADAETRVRHAASCTSGGALVQSGDTVAMAAVAPYLGYQRVRARATFAPLRPLTRIELMRALVNIMAGEGHITLLTRSQTDRVLAGVRDAHTIPLAARSDAATALVDHLISVQRQGVLAPFAVVSRVDLANIVYRSSLDQASWAGQSQVYHGPLPDRPGIVGYEYLTMTDVTQYSQPAPGQQSVQVVAWSVGPTPPCHDVGAWPAIIKICPPAPVTVNTAFRGTVQFSTSTSALPAPAAYTFTAADGGIHTIVITRPLSLAGSVSLTATDSVDHLGVSLALGSMPVIDAVDPNPVTPGHSVTLTGAGFGVAQYGGTVLLSGPASYNMADDIMSWSDTHIDITVPPQVDALETYDIAVVNGRGLMGPSALLTVSPPPPAPLPATTTAPLASIAANGPLDVPSDLSLSTWFANSSVTWATGVAVRGAAPAVTPTVTVPGPQIVIPVPCTITATSLWALRDGDFVAGDRLHCAVKAQIWQPLMAGTTPVADGAGTWVDVPGARGEGTAILGGSNQTAAVTITLPITLTQIASYLRLGVEYDLDDPTLELHSNVVNFVTFCHSRNAFCPSGEYMTPDPTQAGDLSQPSADTAGDYVDAFAAHYSLLPCPSNLLYPGLVTSANGQNPPQIAMVPWNVQCVAPIGVAGHNWVFGPPMAIQIAPTAVIQLKVLPFTLVYQPPGDASKGTFAVSSAFGTTMSVGVGATTNTNIQHDMSGSFTASGSIASLVSKWVGGTATVQYSQQWDTSTTFGTGLAQTSTASQGTLTTTVFSLQIGNKQLVPGAAGTYANEPFWSDTFVLLKNPQIALWDIGGSVQTEMLGAQGTPGNPNFYEPTVLDLATCVTKNEFVDLTTDNCVGASPPPLSTVDHAYLNPQESQALLALDPFYASPTGQNTTFAVGDARAHDVGSTQYGMDPQGSGNEENPSFGQVIQTTTILNQSGTQTYNASVTDLLGSSLSTGLQDSVFGITGGAAVKQGESQTTGAQVAITFSDSTAVTQQAATSITGSFDDTTVRCTNPTDQTTCYRPSVVVYLDKMFGSYMFVDPGAPPQ